MECIFFSLKILDVVEAKITYFKKYILFKTLYFNEKYVVITWLFQVFWIEKGLVQ